MEKRDFCQPEGKYTSVVRMATFLPRFITLSFVFLLLFTSCAPIPQDTPIPTSTDLPTKTDNPTITPTSIPTLTPTITPIPEPPCYDLLPGDTTSAGIPESTNRQDYPNTNFTLPLINSLSYTEDEYYVFSKVLHNRNVTVAYTKGNQGPFESAEASADFIFNVWSVMWNIMGGFPFSSYTVVIRDANLTQNDIQVPTFGFGNGFEVAGFSPGVVAHEIFHSFAPFYILGQSWLAEGLAKYYEHRLGTLYSSGYRDVFYLNEMISTYQIYSGSQYRDLPLTSMLNADILNPDMHARYDDLSYYKGAMMYYLLDVELKKDGHNLDDVIKILYQKYGILDETRYINASNLQQAVEEVSGKDFTEFFTTYIEGANSFSIDPYHLYWVCHDNNPAVIPLAPTIAKASKYNIDGSNSDWAGIKVSLTDKKGDSDNGEFGDLLSLQADKDDIFLYFLLDAGKLPEGKKWALEIFIDSIQGGKCGKADQRIYISSDDDYALGSLRNCDDDYESIGFRGTKAWNNYLEIAIPMSHFHATQEININAVRISMERDETSWYINADWMTAQDFSFENPSPVNVPIQTPDPAPSIIIDGFADDWANITPVKLDFLGDTYFGPDTDIISVSQWMDSIYFYIMVQPAGHIKARHYEMDIYLDTNDSTKCNKGEILVWGGIFAEQDDYPQISINPLDDNCQPKFSKIIQGFSSEWENVLEARIPLGLLGKFEWLNLVGAELELISGKGYHVDRVY